MNKVKEELEYHIYSIHIYRSSVLGNDWKSKVEELGYDVISKGGINWYHFETNCPKDKCIEIRKQLEN